jgi:hypothetical protein
LHHSLLKTFTFNIILNLAYYFFLGADFAGRDFEPELGLDEALPAL